MPIKFTNTLYAMDSFPDIINESPYESYSISNDKKVLTLHITDNDEAEAKGELPYDATLKIVEKTDDYIKLDVYSKPYGAGTIYFYTDKDKAYANSVSVENTTNNVTIPTISVESGFTNDYLNGKTFYSLHLNWVTDTSGWSLVKEVYQNNIFTYNDWDGTSYSNSDTASYNITNGEIVIDPNEDGFKYKILSVTNDYIKVNMIADTTNEEYLYFDETKAKAKLAELKN